MEGRHYIDFPFCSRSFFEIHCKVIRAPTNLSKGKLFTKPSFQDRLINFPLHFAVISLRRSPITRWRVSLPFSPLLSPPFFLNQSVLVPTCLTITVENRSSDDRPGSWRRRNLMEEIRGRPQRWSPDRKWDDNDCFSRFVDRLRWKFAFGKRV